MDVTAIQQGQLTWSFITTIEITLNLRPFNVP